jgi:hypothetical protein
MTDTTPTTAVSVDARRAALAKALRKYSGDGYAVQLSADGLSATLTRKRKVSGLMVLLLTLFTVVGGLIYYLVKATNRKTESLIVYVDERGKVIRS